MGAALSERARGVGAGLVGAAALIAVITVASRVAGFARSLALSSEVGINALGTAYTSANLVPNVLFEVAAGGALAGSVVPLLAAPLARRSRADVDAVTSALLGWTLAVLVPLALVLALVAEPVARLLLQTQEPGTVAVTAAFLRVFAVQVPVYGLAVVLFGVLQAHRRFAWPALAPLLNNLLVIGVLVVFGRWVPTGRDDPGSVAGSALAWLGWGTTAGVALMAACVVVPALRTGLRVRPTLRFPAGVGPRARSLLLAGVGAVVAQQLTVVVTVVLANRYGGDGATPILLFVQQVYLLPYAVLAYPLATATFPQLAERAARDDRPGFARLAARTTRAVLVVAVAGAAALVAGAPGVQAVYAAIADGDVTGTADALAWMAPGLVGFVVAFHVSRALYSLHRGRAAGLAVGAGWVAVAVVAAVAVPLAVPDGTDAARTLVVVAAATTAGMTLAGAATVGALVRAAGRAAVAGVVRTTAVALAAGAAGAAGGRVLGDAVLPADAGLLVGVVAALAAAVTAVLVLLGALAVADRSVLRTLVARGGSDTPAVPEDAGDRGGPGVR